MFEDRIARARRRMEELGVDVLLLSVGADLPYFTGYTAMPLERLTMLVLPRESQATLVVPALEAPRVEERPEAFTTRPWAETEDPVAIVADLAGAGRAAPGRAAIGDRTWATFLLGLQEALPQTAFLPASRVTGPLRAVKDAAEIDALRAAARVVDAVALALRDRPFAGRTEADISRELVDRMLEGGHERANFAIVASGPNAASPHHEPGDRVVEPGDSVVCDFGGTMAGYCSDITRTFVVGQPGGELADLYEVLFRAQEEAVRTARGRRGRARRSTPPPARSSPPAATATTSSTGRATASASRSTRTLTSSPGNATPLAPGHAFSVEPGIYLPGRCGARIEDIVVATNDGPERLNQAPRELAVVG